MNETELLIELIYILPPRIVLEDLFFYVKDVKIKEYITTTYVQYLKSLVRKLREDFLCLISREREHFQNLSDYITLNPIPSIPQERLEMIKKAYSIMSVDHINCGIWSFARFAAIYDKKFESDFCSEERKFTARCTQYIEGLDGAQRNKPEWKDAYESDEEIRKNITLRKIPFEYPDSLKREIQLLANWMYHLNRLNESFRQPIQQQIKTNFSNETRGDGAFYRYAMFPSFSEDCPEFMMDKKYFIWEHKKSWEKLIYDFDTFFKMGIHENNTHFIRI